MKIILDECIPRKLNYSPPDRLLGRANKPCAHRMIP
jgi:hypothetical protein